MSAWTREFAPATLKTLMYQVMNAFELTIEDMGIKGNERHDYGYHRSRGWILEDGRGRNDYSVWHNLDQTGNADWLSALDIGLPPDQMKIVTRRLMTAAHARDPRMRTVREFFGTLDGETVTGWDLADHDATTSDDSHLTHVHISFFRSRAADDHSGVFSVLTEDGDSDMPLSPEDVEKVWRWYRAPGGMCLEDHLLNAEGAATRSEEKAESLLKLVAELMRRLDALEEKIETGGMDLDELAERFAAKFAKRLEN